MYSFIFVFIFLNESLIFPLTKNTKIKTISFITFVLPYSLNFLIELSMNFLSHWFDVRKLSYTLHYQISLIFKNANYLLGWFFFFSLSPFDNKLFSSLMRICDSEHLEWIQWESEKYQWCTTSVNNHFQVLTVHWVLKIFLEQAIWAPEWGWTW